ncbi:hypothetical protein ACN2XU_03690 [Primorskyibacter sp. 2E107]|uniref:hypothetical protein n=1 Tax=Primorskyibacter sp. 2E107 TaxID=3403458 RepID=UPI003AF9B0BF
MPRWLWFLPLGLIVLLGALQAFRLGWIAANMTQTAAIEAYAARFGVKEGAGLTGWNCVGTPGEDTWLVVRCGVPGREWKYRVNRFGGLTGIVPPGGGLERERPEA